jgi:hypothetical protein
VVLTIPPGALASPVLVRVVPTVDDTPLPPNAERVGPQFRVEPAGTMLSMSAQLSLPVTQESVGAFLGSAADVKVWLRGTDGWTLTEPSASVPGTVRIPMQRFTTAAAGVRFSSSLTSLCGTSGFPTCTTSESTAATMCTLTNGFCLQNVSGSLPVRSGPLVARPGQVFFNSGANGSTVSAARLIVSSLATTTLSGSSLGGSNLAPVSTTTVWSDQTRFNFTTRTFAGNVIPGGLAARVVSALGNGKVATYGTRNPASGGMDSQRLLMVRNGETGAIEVEPTLIQNYPAGNPLFAMTPDPRDPNRLLALVTANTPMAGGQVLVLSTTPPAVVGTIALPSDSLFAIQVCSGGGGDECGTVIPRFFVAGGNRLFTHDLDASGRYRRLLVADLNVAAPSFAPVNIPGISPAPAPVGTAFSSVGSGTITADGTLWFTFGQLNTLNLFRFSAANVLEAVQSADRPVSVAASGNDVFATFTNTLTLQSSLVRVLRVGP